MLCRIVMNIDICCHAQSVTLYITFKSGIAKSTLKNLVIEIKGIFFTRDPFTLIPHSRFSS